MTSVPGPEFGGSSGGVVSFTSKPGSNAFHGSAYEYLRNTVLDANNFFNNASGVSRPQLIQNQFGGTVGGPIAKNRTFFFFNYERLTRRNGIPSEGRTPTPAELSGDFRADPPIYDPQTGLQFVCNGVLNVICANRIDPTANVMANVLHYWPAPDIVQRLLLQRWEKSVSVTAQGESLAAPTAAVDLHPPSSRDVDTA